MYETRTMGAVAGSAIAKTSEMVEPDIADFLPVPK
jgi:hypothetical protein